MSEKKYGVVIETRRGNYWTEVVGLLTPKELGEGFHPLLGEFVKVVVSENGRVRTYVGMVQNLYYAPINQEDYVASLAIGHLNDEVDEAFKEKVQYLHYVVHILGSYEIKDGQVVFTPSTRFVPPITNTTVHPFPDEDLSAVLRASLANQGGDGSEAVFIGHLAYGGEPQGDRPGVWKTVDPALFAGKRTANLGKTGFGKSNENKLVVLMVAKRFPEHGFLILDLNGEYFTQKKSTTSMGLLQAFMRLGLKDRIRFFTLRNVEHLEAQLDSEEGEAWRECARVIPLKVNFYAYPELAVELVYKRVLFSGEKPPQYLENAYSNMGAWRGQPNRMAYVYGTLLQAGLEPPSAFKVPFKGRTYDLGDYLDREEFIAELDKGASKNEEGGKSSEGGRDLYTYHKRFAFLNRLHSPEALESFIDTIANYFLPEELFPGWEPAKTDKAPVAIVDIPSLGDLADFVVARLVSVLLERAIASTGRRLANFTILLEEAHNLLSDRNGIFYRVAREGRKYGIGMIYSTQSPASVPMDILSQTENFFIKHLSSEEDVKTLQRAKAQFALVSKFLLGEPIIGYSYVYSEPYQPFVVPLKMRLVDEVVEEMARE